MQTRSANPKGPDEKRFSRTIHTFGMAREAVAVLFRVTTPEYYSEQDTKRIGGLKAANQLELDDRTLVRMRRHQRKGKDGKGERAGEVTNRALNALASEEQGKKWPIRHAIAAAALVAASVTASVMISESNSHPAAHHKAGIGSVLRPHGEGAAPDSQHRSGGRLSDLRRE